VVRDVVLTRYPALAAAFERLGGTLSAETMRRLNYAVDGEHRNIADVVREFRAAPRS
jgi:osmoprotectant transport system substrate-binding protein